MGVTIALTIYVVNLCTLISYRFGGKDKTVGNTYFGDTIVNKYMNFKFSKDFMSILC